MAETLEKKKENKGWANLRPVKKGEIRNPHGRPKKADSLIDCIKTELAKKAANGIDTNEQMIAWALVSKAQHGDLKAIEILISYTTPKPTQVQELDITSKGQVIGNGHVEIPETDFRQALAIVAGATVSKN